ncbi:ATP-binding protein [Sphingomonas sp. KR1UV-12]|uniref:histidine kinase n=1 Tax=Sphingomonas aurea TaxID=3063994 RepID=A0ABT9EHC0_9SPHN|nr:ATP-binding protein [Sphingomonas sp. KR1UV-12]MDP1026173.1 ATP-binding protein [Sphingomonas sp. KR1UV-12]
MDAVNEDRSILRKLRGRSGLRYLEAGVLACAILAAAISYLTIFGDGRTDRPVHQTIVVILLIANIIPGALLIVLAGRRVALRREPEASSSGSRRLHVRLVASFSAMAAVPMLLVVIASSLLFQFGVDFFSSDRSRGMIENAMSIPKENLGMELSRVAREAEAMSGDLSFYLQSQPLDQQFSRYLFDQTYRRNLSEAMIFRPGEDPLAVLNPYGRPLLSLVSADMIAKLNAGAKFVLVRRNDRAGVLVPFADRPGYYLYAARVYDDELLRQIRRGEMMLTDYRGLQERSRVLQLRFNIALYALSLLIIGIAVWIALKVADRLVSPIGDLVVAARRVADGDLSTRVPDPGSRDEVAALANAFNQMTGRIQEQNGELLAANTQLDSRRALIEAVMAGVSAGVIATTPGRTISIANASAGRLLGADASGIVGRELRDVAPTLDALVGGGVREAVVEVGSGAAARTLAVRCAEIDRGPILTFDDVTQQLSDQRRAAWADVARRIAHEIKNPLTPIQLAAERLQRRYGSKIEADDGTFQRLTETIVRQVGDLRRMVDEFSSFARMPKPVFRMEPLLDTARQAMFLHEVAHPTIRFELVHDDPGPSLVCDRRQIGQALTNIVKNAVEAIEARGGEGGEIVMTLAEPVPDQIVLTVADNGVGLPEARDRIAEPYMTTRARGTGLGLAIVKKIVEEHGGTIAFSDRPGGGTVVTMTFDAARLASLDHGEPEPELAGEGQLAALTQNRI